MTGTTHHETQTGERRYRTLLLSDVHLGTKGCQAEALLEFLKNHDAETIYLVGDIVDGWRLKTGWYWPQTHNDVVQKLLGTARKGSRIISCHAITTSSCMSSTARISAASRSASSDNFRSSSIQGIMDRLKAKGVPPTVYELLIAEDDFSSSPVMYDLTAFKTRTDLIVANRMTTDLADVADKVFSRDLFGAD